MGYDDLNPEYLPPKSEPEKQGRGCFFYGCLFAIIAMVLGIVIVSAGGYWLYRQFVNTAIEYTDTVPEAMPPVTMPVAERKAIHERVDGFNTALKEHKPTKPLVLSADEINALIDDNPKLKGKAHVEIKDDKVLARISLPLSELPIAELKERYLNGSATLRLSISDGEGNVRMDDVVVKGKPLPDAVAKALAEQNVVKGAFKDDANDGSLDEIDSVVVQNGTVIITPKPVEAEKVPAKVDDNIEEPKPGDAAIEEPKAEEPKTEEPKAEEPKAEEPALPEPKPNQTDDPGTPAPDDLPKAA